MLKIDERGFLSIDGIVICRVQGEMLEFKDKDRYRSAERGTRFVRVGLGEFMRDLADVTREADAQS